MAQRRKKAKKKEDKKKEEVRKEGEKVMKGNEGEKDEKNEGRASWFFFFSLSFFPFFFVLSSLPVTTFDSETRIAKGDL